jgi:hypothetical protein
LLKKSNREVSNSNRKQGQAAFKEKQNKLLKNKTKDYEKDFYIISLCCYYDSHVKSVAQ